MSMDVSTWGSHHPLVFETESDRIRYFKEAGVILVGSSVLAAEEDAIRPYLDSFEAGFNAYLGDYAQDIGDAEQIIKMAGQTCYLSYGTGRTKNADHATYFRNLIEQNHTSVLEHASFTFLVYGISRSLTHELVRHRVGVSFSQVSQRYVGPERLRFVMRPEYAGVPELEYAFESWIEASVREYISRRHSIESFTYMQPIPQADSRAARMQKMELQKAMNQAARGCLPNETEAPLVVTFNVQSFRHFLYRRGNPHAEPEIRLLAQRLFEFAKKVVPASLQDCQISESPDGFGQIQMGVSFADEPE